MLGKSDSAKEASELNHIYCGYTGSGKLQVVALLNEYHQGLSSGSEWCEYRQEDILTRIIQSGEQVYWTAIQN